VYHDVDEKSPLWTRSMNLRGSPAANGAGNLLFLHWVWSSMIWRQVVTCKQVVKSFYHAWISSVSLRFIPWWPCLSPPFPSDREAPFLVPRPALPQDVVAFHRRVKEAENKGLCAVSTSQSSPHAQGMGWGRRVHTELTCKRKLRWNLNVQSSTQILKFGRLKAQLAGG